MKNVSSLKTKNESPKTPGGISKSLLTPCRRVGLSRSWRKGGPSPFVSPLAGNAEVVQEKDTRKRKSEESTKNIDSENDIQNESIDKTPTRSVAAPRRKKSKILSNVNNSETRSADIENSNDNTSKDELPKTTNLDTKIESAGVVTPVLLKSKIKSKKFESPLNTSMIHIETNIDVKENSEEVVKLKEKQILIQNEVANKKNSPENLTKECIVVIQKKIFKKDLRAIDKQDKNNTVTEKDSKTDAKCNTSKVNDHKPTSQTLFDSDSDDVPLCQINKKVPNNPQISKPVIIDEDDDFTENNKIKVKKLEDKTTSTGSLKKNKKKTKEKAAVDQKEVEPPKELWSIIKAPSQSSIDDDDDFEFDKKKTILIRKCYEKVTKPLKAKSTGSITQKDIDELKSRIEVKKKLLLAKAMTQDTEELRGLIKKWQRGCQDALMELMELMRNKFPDKQNMDYSEMLQSLKIPSALVGYDADNDCFNTPDDTSIILSKFND